PHGMPESKRDDRLRWLLPAETTLPLRTTRASARVVLFASESTARLLGGLDDRRPRGAIDCEAEHVRAAVVACDVECPVGEVGGHGIAVGIEDSGRLVKRSGNDRSARRDD